jgi:uncharacterized protein YdaU (DUF1376 family)
MPSPYHYMPFHHKDWLSSSTVRMMSLTAQGIYMNLILTQWEDEHLPAEQGDLKLLVKATDDEWKSFERFVDQCFPVCEDGFRRNNRVAEERLEIEARVEKNRQNGSRGGRPPKTERKPIGLNEETEEKPNANQTVSEIETQTKPNENPLVSDGLTQSKPNENPDETISKSKSKSKKNPHNPPAGEVGVEEISGESWKKPTWSEFWTEFKNRYPKRGPGDSNNFPNAETKVKAAWSKAKCPEALDEILQALDSLSAWASWKEANSPEWTRTYVPMASTWVNQRAKAGSWFDDERVAPTGTGSRSATGGPRSIPKPVSGVDFEFRYDPEADMSRRFLPGTDQPFVESEWLKAQIGREAA